MNRNTPYKPNSIHLLFFGGKYFQTGEIKAKLSALVRGGGKPGEPRLEMSSITVLRFDFWDDKWG